MLSKNNILLYNMYKLTSIELHMDISSQQWHGHKLLDLDLNWTTLYQGYKDEKIKVFICTRFELPVFLLLQIWHANELNGQKYDWFPTYTLTPSPL